MSQLQKSLLTPLKSLKKEYIPLLTIYFSYGLSGFSAVALTFWEKENLTLSAEQLISISVWVMIPWTLKMVFGQMIDTVPILGSRRKAYIFIGAIFMTLGTILLAGLAGNHEQITSIGTPYTIYLLSALFSTLGFVIQDVTADTMSTEVVPPLHNKQHTTARTRNTIRPSNGTSSRKNRPKPSPIFSSRPIRIFSKNIPIRINFLGNINNPNHLMHRSKFCKTRKNISRKRKRKNKNRHKNPRRRINLRSILNHNGLARLGIFPRNSVHSFATLAIQYDIPSHKRPLQRKTKNTFLHTNRTFHLQSHPIRRPRTPMVEHRHPRL